MFLIKIVIISKLTIRQGMSVLIAFGFKQIYLTDSNAFSIDFGVFFVGYFRGPASGSLSLFAMISNLPDGLPPKLASENGPSEICVRQPLKNVTFEDDP